MRGERATAGEAARDAVRRFNQLASPLAAKAVEDTAFYRYGRLISRNDVGFSPDVFALSRERFLIQMEHRAKAWPRSLLATATHDHKRGEDVRARLAVLSEIPAAWENAVGNWFRMNRAVRGPLVRPASEYQLYQTLVGCWPFDAWPIDAESLDEFRGRILRWQEKALREAKQDTSWSAPNKAFETENADFVRAILDVQRSAAFLDQLHAFVVGLAPAGAMNSLVQCALRCLSPGVPDLYQGAELWDLSLVDPDNRRAVDFPMRFRIAAERGGSSQTGWRSGAMKLRLIARLIMLRAERPQLFAKSTFEPLRVEGPRGDHVIAFCRTAGSQTLLVAVPRLCAEACIDSGSPLPSTTFWEGTAITVGEELRGLDWHSALDGSSVRSFECGALLRDLPSAVLVADRG
jgi:(1->4)-alpha-D-glucan 1-alpha-D-glucosylmutase